MASLDDDHDQLLLAILQGADVPDWLLDRPAWMADAACAEHDLELWFPANGQSPKPAKAICRSCLVVDECLEHALEAGEVHGIWGATSPEERRQLRRSAA